VLVTQSLLHFVGLSLNMIIMLLLVVIIIIISTSNNEREFLQNILEQTVGNNYKNLTVNNFF